MAKEQINKTYKQRFLDGFKILTRSRNLYEVWSDTMYLFACGISNPTIVPLKDINGFKDVWEEREQEYCVV